MNWVRQKICKYCSFGGDKKLLDEYFRLETYGYGGMSVKYCILYFW